MQGINWQPIATVPKDGSYVLLYYPSRISKKWDVGTWNVYETFQNGISTHRSEGWTCDSQLVFGRTPSAPSHWAVLNLPEIEEKAA